MYPLAPTAHRISDSYHRDRGNNISVYHLKGWISVKRAGGLSSGRSGVFFTRVEDAIMDKNPEAGVKGAPLLQDC
jgi:hypothetical protein